MKCCKTNNSSSEIGAITVPLVEVDIGLLADQVGITTANTLDLSQGVHDLALSIDVGIEETQDVLNKFRENLANNPNPTGPPYAYLELLVGFGDDERHGGGSNREKFWVSTAIDIQTLRTASISQTHSSHANPSQTDIETA
jgi:hypothetical protein